MVGVAWGGWHWAVSRHYESTDNAYVQGNVIQITPQIGGTVLAIVGLVILVVMFVFSFLGGLFTPYSQAQVFQCSGHVINQRE